MCGNGPEKDRPALETIRPRLKAGVTLWAEVAQQKNRKPAGTSRLPVSAFPDAAQRRAGTTPEGLLLFAHL